MFTKWKVYYRLCCAAHASIIQHLEHCHASVWNMFVWQYIIILWTKIAINSTYRSNFKVCFLVKHKYFQKHTFRLSVLITSKARFWRERCFVSNAYILPNSRRLSLYIFIIKYWCTETNTKTLRQCYKRKGILTFRT